jgi:hypothetical protein
MAIGAGPGRPFDPAAGSTSDEPMGVALVGILLSKWLRRQCEWPSAQSD